MFSPRNWHGDSHQTSTKGLEDHGMDPPRGLRGVFGVLSAVEHAGVA